jgi:rubrerythrin
LLSQIPISLKKVSQQDLDKEILRAGMIAELDAINLYEQMAAETTNDTMKRVLLDVAKEEKTHFGEFQILLLEHDKEQADELEVAKEEIRALLGQLRQLLKE